MHSANDLFQLQVELNDRRVNMAVNEAIERLERSMENFKNELKQEMQAFKAEMRIEFQEFKAEMRSEYQELKTRLIIVETKLGLVNANQYEIRTRFIDYTFKSAWVLLGAVASYAFMHFHMLT